MNLKTHDAYEEYLELVSETKNLWFTEPELWVYNNPPYDKLDWLTVNEIINTDNQTENLYGNLEDENFKS
jgi:hypothetical protein